MEFRTLRDIMYGSVSDPQLLLAGNEYDTKDFQDWMIDAWRNLGWICLEMG